MTDQTQVSEPRLDQLVERLRSHVTGLKRLPSERRLAETLGENRYMLRRALAVLRDAGDLPALPARERREDVADQRQALLHGTNPVEMWELRLMFEPDLARLASLRASPGEIEQLARIHADTGQTAFDLEADIAFHCLIARASRNSLAYFVVELLTDLTRDDTFRMLLPAFTQETGFDHHQMILDAIRDREPARAEAAMRLHLSAIHRWLTGFPDDSLTQEPPK
ncbi:FadR/GntR family transcriptional regulator [Pseudooceanicola nanhaiensis]|uniref:FadR/GntR family transcriptional regulator n=1 Tax=Pseudooceanicola nanhaiensis TaxID=375761 RepID=UPI001CD511CA|nr:FCD domain-containing protein [Pseudooceanicola nanhaiensis]MCA0921292.1 FCD domain-containing protein [Pseudooceanicola nanhaiensis]